MARPKYTMPEDLKATIEQDLASGKSRGTICKERGVSYIQLQQTFGFMCKRPRKVFMDAPVNVDALLDNKN